jgi:hypothetical protein
VEAVIELATKDTKIIVLALSSTVSRMDPTVVLPDMVEKRIKLALMEDAVAVDNVFRVFPLMVENEMVEVSTVEANNDEVKIENPLMEETVI